MILKVLRGVYAISLLAFIFLQPALGSWLMGLIISLSLILYLVDEDWWLSLTFGLAIVFIFAG